MSRYWESDAVTPIPVPGARPLLYVATLHDPDALACPICGGGNLHLTGNGPADTQDATVSFDCEGGDHPFGLRFHFHKGTVFVSVVPTATSTAQLDAELAAARSEVARLEGLREQGG